MASRRIAGSKSNVRRRSPRRAHTRTAEWALRRTQDFIVSLWEALAGDARADGIDLAAFKRWLLEANAKQSIVLARADHVGAMDPNRVAASAILDRGASFRFLLDNR
jgi:hypothetical protein